MRYFFLLLSMIISGAVYSAALVGPMVTRVDNSGILAEPDVPIKMAYRIVAELNDTENSYHDNQQTIKMLHIVVGDVRLSIPKNEIEDLNLVALEKIYITYTHNFIGESWIELFIPYGQSKLCTDHKKEVDFIKNSKKILSFTMQGKFLKSENVVPCYP